MKSHEEFIDEVKEAISLPARTKKALGPVTKEDFELDES